MLQLKLEAGAGWERWMRFRFSYLFCHGRHVGSRLIKVGRWGLCVSFLWGVESVGVVKWWKTDFAPFSNLVRCCTDAYLSESSETEKHGVVRWPGTGCWRHTRRTPAVTSHVSFSTQRLYTTFQLRSSWPSSELQERAGFYARRSLEWSGQHLQFHSIAHSLDSFHRCRSYQNLARKMWTWR